MKNNFYGIAFGKTLRSTKGFSGREKYSPLSFSSFFRDFPEVAGAINMNSLSRSHFVLPDDTADDTEISAVPQVFRRSQILPGSREDGRRQR